MHSVYSNEPLSAEVCDVIDRGKVSSVLFVTRNANRSAWQLDRLRDLLRRLEKANERSSRSTWQSDRLRDVLRRLGKGNGGPSRRKATVVVLASCGPYDLLPRALVPGLKKDEGAEMGLDEVAYLVSFDYTGNALDAAAGVIFGEEDAKGHVPVCGGNILP
jgi:beta-N-acetylhexosaminidase